MSDSRTIKKGGTCGQQRGYRGKGAPFAFDLHFEPRDFHRQLLGWYDANKRSLPWRTAGSGPDPYRVWLSEVMLQQTTVKTAIPYYMSFLAKWPTVEALARAPRDEVLSAWAGLGYYSRARNLHACARLLAANGFPTCAAELERLPGIGPYTAAAIAAIAFGEPAAVVDGNITRVLARLFAVETPLPAAKRCVLALAAALTPPTRPGDHAQALMDLGAEICTPKRPLCHRCPLASFCLALNSTNPERFPLKAAKAPRPERWCQAFVLVCDEFGEPRVLLRPRQDRGLLGGMLEVPSTAWSAHADDPCDTCENPFTGLEDAAWREGGEITHVFTHFKLIACVRAARPVSKDFAAGLGGDWVPLDGLQDAALPTLMRKILRRGLSVLEERF